MKIKFYYIPKEEYQEIISGKKIANINCNTDLFVEPIKYEPDNISGYIIARGGYHTHDGIRIFTYFSDYSRGEFGYFTSDGKTFYKIMGFHNIDNDRVLVNLKREELNGEKVNTKKEPKRRKQTPRKIYARLQKEINLRCPFCPSTDVEHFEVHHVDGNRFNDEYENLMLVCPTCHSKIEKGDISRQDVEQKKQELMNQVPRQNGGEQSREVKSVEEYAVEVNNEYEFQNKRFDFIKSKEGYDSANKLVKDLFKLIGSKIEAIKKKAPLLEISPHKNSTEYEFIASASDYLLNVVWNLHYSNSLDDTQLKVCVREGWKGLQHNYDRSAMTTSFECKFEFGINKGEKIGWIKGTRNEFYDNERLAEFILAKLLAFAYK